MVAARVEDAAAGNFVGVEQTSPVTAFDSDYTTMVVAFARSAMLSGWVPISTVIATAQGEFCVGTNQRVQADSPTRHAEIDALELWGRPRLARYPDATMYCSLSPCLMCSGAIILSGIKRLVVADRRTFEGPTQLLRDSGVEVSFVDSDDAFQTMSEFRARSPELWAEDNGGA